MQSLIEQLFDNKPATYTAAHRELFTQFLASLNAGHIRAAEPDPASKPYAATRPTGVAFWTKVAV